MPDDLREALARMAQATWGYDLAEAVWIEPFLIDLGIGRSERLAIESREADPGSVNLHPLAAQVLDRARRSVLRLAPSVELPAWITPQLAFYLLKRFSFSGGGGPLAALTKESIREMLAELSKLKQCLRADAEWADRFAKELALLEAHCATPKPAAVAAKRTRAAIVDAEHATPKERHEAREALRNHKPCLARVEGQRIVWFDNGFVGLRLLAPAIG